MLEVCSQLSSGPGGRTSGLAAYGALLRDLQRELNCSTPDCAQQHQLRATDVCDLR